MASDVYAAKKRIHDAAMELFGEGSCLDGGCVFGHPGGMQTNGGCQHIKERERFELRRTVQKLAAVARRLATEGATTP